ncbi:hypothetical protein [Methylobacterium sp. J-076]|uniref:hypothetical protein n=1 Tax=Methylobacterium sp. J-076 TaxID=2836655 RepID=UPI001FBBA0C4|nr:hypothetical protein [Methylobacterium sp. J-076]MCJ2011283.1 hypothetical protein [Methylobacterium sp. J-076]
MSFNSTVALIDSANHSYDAALLADTSAALGAWSRNLYGKGTIDIQVTVSNATSIGTANGGPATSVFLAKDGSVNIFRGGAESELLTGVDPNGASPDIQITIDPSFIDKYLFIDPDPAHPTALPSNKTSAIQILEHEIGHGLGIVGFRDTNTGALTGAESPWDKLVRIDADGTAAFTGGAAQAVFGGAVHVTTEHNAEQYYHLGSSAADLIAADLMAGYGAPLGTRYDVSNVDLAILRDLGLKTFGSAGGTVLVDSVFYAQKGPDVARAHVDPVAHYTASGWHEGRDPNALFSTNGYLAANADVAKAGMNPLAHYDQFGWHEGRDPSAGFDNELYLKFNPDVAQAGLDPLSHYLSSGQFEGRQTYAAIGKAGDLGVHPGFDAEYYLLVNPDVAKAALTLGGDTFAFAYQHFAQSGWREGRNPNADFDVKYYLAHYQDVAAAQIDPLAHYDQFGWKEGRDPSAAFHTAAYETANADVAAAHVDPLLHYLQFGALEGRHLA